MDQIIVILTIFNTLCLLFVYIFVIIVVSRANISDETSIKKLHDYMKDTRQIIEGLEKDIKNQWEKQNEQSQT